MAIIIESTHLNGITILKPDIFGDRRGFFMESFREDYLRALNIPTSFPQDNHSRSSKGVLRGMHFQWDPPQGKLIRVTRGTAFCAWIDIRKNSPTLGKWFGKEFSDDDPRIIWLPPGFANGFCALTDVVEIQYKCTNIYNNKAEASILWNDQEVGIEWPVSHPTISEKDAKGITLKEWILMPESDHFNPAFGGTSRG